MTPARRLAARLARSHTRIAARLLLFNVLLVFLPVAGLVYLDAYEQHLLEQQERAMVDAGRVLSTSLAELPFDEATTTRIATGLSRNTDARFRVVAPGGRVLADSHAGQPPPAAIPEDPYASPPRGNDPVRSSWLYQTGAALGRGVRRLFVSPTPVSASEAIVVSPGVIAAPEVDAALAGAYRAATRLSPGGQRSVTLYIALPVRQQDTVVGAVLVSQSTWRILQRIYDVRLRMFSVVVVSLGFAVVLMAIASFTIVTPVRRLRDDAVTLADRRGRLTHRFRGTERRDEIGELARALDDLTHRLEAHLRFTERFSADVTHEFRNPLASIRASAETLADAELPDDRERFRARIERDIGRLEVLLHGVRDVTSVDAQLEEEPRTDVDLPSLVRDCAAMHNGRCVVDAGDERLVVEASPDRIRQILDNLIDNADSFTPQDSNVRVDIRRDGNIASVRVRDRGPGIPEQHLERIFERFFCYRPGQPDARHQHSGLGLPIARTIARSYGGDVLASNHPDGGAVFELRLPLKS